jgi:lipopolysaccharide heptosyltransferase II
MGKFDSTKLGKLRFVDGFLKKIYVRPKNKKSYPPLDRNKVQNIIVLGMMMIGDTVMMLPALRTIRNNFPNAKLCLVCNTMVKTVLENESLIDHYFIVNSPWLSKNYSFNVLTKFVFSLTKINEIKYDLAIDFRGDWRNIFFMNFIKSIRKSSFNYTGGEYMLTDVIEGNPAIDLYSDEWLYFLEKLGLKIVENDRIPKLHLSDDEIQFTKQFKIDNNISNQNIIGIHPGASQEVKKWSEEKYADVIKKFSQEYPDSVFIIYEGPNERDTVQKIDDLLKDHALQYIIVYERLRKYMSLISICNLIICNDSGAAHLAGAFGVPTVVIFGNVDPKFVTPRGAKMIRIVSHMMSCKPCHQSVCKYGTNECIRDINTEEVFGPVLEIAQEFTIK